MNKKIFLTTTCVLLSIVILAQPSPPPSPPCWPPPCIPIDGGISFFTILAALIGYRFYRKNK
jgi:hypothetical protein